jgi:hypothetical protein
MENYIKINKVSERLTGDQFKIRKTSPKFQGLIAELNKSVEQIISKSELTDEQKNIGKNISK